MSKSEGRCTHPNCEKLSTNECGRCEAPTCRKHRRGHDCHYACCDTPGAKAHGVDDCPVMKITPEQIASEKQRLREEAQDRVLGLMARKGLTFSAYDSFIGATELFIAQNSVSNPNIRAFVDQVQAELRKFKQDISVLRAVARADPAVDIPEIAQAGLILGAHWTFLPAKK